MNTITLGVMGAMSSLVALPMASAAGATTPAVPQAHSYADLLEPIPNASERLRLADATLGDSTTAEGDARLIPAAWHYRWVRERVYSHRRLRHRRYRRGYYYYGYRYYAPPVIPYVYPFYYHHHHHHHHHHHFYF